MRSFTENMRSSIKDRSAKLQKIWEEVAMGLCKVLSWNLPARNEKKHLVCIVNIPAVARTGNLSNTSHKLYRFLR
jgi:hypothetical protein